MPKPNIPSPPASPGAKPSLSGGGLLVSLMPVESVERRELDVGRAAVIAAIIVLIAALAVGTAYFVLARTAALRTAEIAAMEAKIAQFDATLESSRSVINEAKLFKEQADAVKYALDHHVDWRKILLFLEENATPTIRFLNFNGDIETGTVSIDAFGSSYKDIADQIVLLREHPSVIGVKSSSAASVINATGEITGVSATITVKFDQKLVIASGDASPSVEAAQ